MGKYESLKYYLQGKQEKAITLSFEEIENIIESTLPKTAYNNPTWWSNDETSHVQSRAWLDADWKTCEIKLGESIKFKKII